MYIECCKLKIYIVRVLNDHAVVIIPVDGVVIGTVLLVAFVFPFVVVVSPLICSR